MEDSPVLVLGHRGLLGRALVEACGGRCQVIEGGREAFDLARTGRSRPLPPPGQDPPEAGQAREALALVSRELGGRGPAAAAVHAGLDLEGRAILSRAPRLVFNCAGYTDVDGAESRSELAMAVNAAGAQAVALACAEAGAHLVHISTDYVFDGKSGRPYREDDPPAPLSAYGRSKLEGERLVRQTLPGCLIVRSAWLFGPGRSNFVEKVVAKGRLGEPFAVVADEVGSPTYAPDLAEAVLDLGRSWTGGVLHVVNQGQASRLELARASLELAGIDPGLIRPVTSAELGLAASRPAYSVLEAGGAARLRGGPLPDWRDALRRYISRHLARKEQA